MEDSRIVDLYWERSEQAIYETQLKYDHYCFSIANNILPFREDAEESVNDTYMTAWNVMPPNRPSILSTFLGKLTRRISIDRWRNLSADKRGGGTVPIALDELAEEYKLQILLEFDVEIQFPAVEAAFQGHEQGMVRQPVLIFRHEGLIIGILADVAALICLAQQFQAVFAHFAIIHPLRVGTEVHAVALLS